MVAGEGVAESSAAALAAELGCSDEVVAQLGVLWGKSAGKAGGRANLLVGHLLDTAAVAEQMWLHYLAPSVRSLLDRLSGGQGVRLFMWLCAVHDCGKATPVFQAVDEEGARKVRAAGLGWNAARIRQGRWRHDKAGARVLLDVLRGVWAGEQISWVWPLVAGHHGSFPALGTLTPPARGEVHGRGAAWRAVQEAVVAVVTRAIGYPDLGAVAPRAMPTRAEQLVLSGLLVMADWIASDGQFFTGVDDLCSVSLAGSRERAGTAWQALRLRGGWGALLRPERDLVRARFGEQARPLQQVVERTAWEMPAPGLMIVEAPMGEGKTKAALVAAEVLAARCGADGVFVGMPTQATSDPMFSQVRKWATAFGADVAEQVVLLHGKRMFNLEWRGLLAGAGENADEVFEGIFEDDPLGVDCGGSREGAGPAEWFLGRKRGLLASLAVGTIDQLLHAATRTRHVMLRFAGLAGKVVILDEVHAADIYMEQFLAEALRWLAQASVPVIVLSATLPPRQRRTLVEAYLSGTRTAEQPVVGAVPDPVGYPCVTAAFPQRGRDGFLVAGAPPWRASQRVAVEVLPDRDADGGAGVERLCRELAGGGVALVVRNTVDRAQATFTALREHFGEDVWLLHGRLCAADRAERTEECLDLLGPTAGPRRPKRMIIVATQLAEQSFDIDADLLMCDLAPVDLLLQRIGRLHRHGGIVRPAGLASPRVIVTGVQFRSAAPPQVVPASEAIYGRHRLLRAAALVQEAITSGWSIPADVPDLVARAYGDDPVVPVEWEAEAQAAAQAWELTQEDRARRAERFLLSRRGETRSETLEGLHYGQTHGMNDEDELTALVRDGEPSVEVIVVRKHTAGGYTALNGTRIGINGEASEQVLDDVLAGMTRLPTKLTTTAETELRPLAGWTSNPWLRHTRALVLDESGWTQVGRRWVSYDPLLGLAVTANPSGGVNPAIREGK